MVLELILEPILGDGFFWFKHAVDVELVLISLGSTRDGFPFHDDPLRDVEMFLSGNVLSGNEIENVYC